jgi:hypothetical protein
MKASSTKIKKEKLDIVVIAKSVKVKEKKNIENLI